jgi:hypothetical protein
MFEWMSDGAMYEARAHGAAMATAEAAKEVGVLALAVAGTAGGLSALAAYNNAKDPKKGMPQLGPIGLDTGVAAAGLLAAIFAGEYLGETGQTIALGIGLGGLGSVASNYGAAFGHKAAMAGVASALGEGNRVGNLSPEAQRIYDEYAGR